jgi:dolichol kinase
MMKIYELVATVLLFVWVVLVAAILTRKLYSWMRSRGFEHFVAVYYNRKVIHMLAGGVCAIAVPFVFSTPLFPFVIAGLLAIFTYIPHKIGKLMYWFQTEDNMYEVTFSLMWGIIITLGWLVSGDFLVGVLPVLFMSVGDAITGIVRNYLYKKRTKSWWGNLAMAVFCVSVGTVLGIAGVIAGGAASIIEHFEFYPIDDNITVPLISFLLLVLAESYAPWLLTF